jgi:PAS domain S-box-containing protein
VQPDPPGSSARAADRLGTAASGLLFICGRPLTFAARIGAAVGGQGDTVTTRAGGVRPHPSPWQRRVVSGITVALVYVIAGRLGLLLAVPPGYATAIFPPAGIAVAAAFSGGRAILPWIFAGSCILNLWLGAAAAHLDLTASTAIALWIAGASTLQAAIGGWSLRTAIGYPSALDNLQDLGRFLLLAPAICLVSASVSIGGMVVLEMLGPGQLAPNWFAWWIGDTLGVLLFFPLVMVVAGEPREFWRARTLPVAVPMLLFFALFAAIFVRTRMWERDQSLAEFKLQSQAFADRLQSQLIAQDDLIQQLRASWTAVPHPTRSEFTMLTRYLIERFPAVQAVAWAPRVTISERTAFEATQQHDSPGFAIRERGPDGSLRVAGDQPAYYPVTFINRLPSNQSALGFDLASDATRDAAIRKTAETGAPAATAPVSLLQAPNERSGVLLMLAVPQSASGPGVLLTVLNLRHLVDAVLGSAAEVLDVQLIDIAAGGPLLDPPPADAGAARFDHTVTFAGRVYRIITTPGPDYLAQHQGWQSWAVLLTGVLSTSLLGALLMLSTGERRRFARLLAERTRERDQIWQVSEDLLGVSNFDGYFTSVNPAWTRTLGWTEEEIKRQHVSELRHPDDAPVGTEGRRRLAEGAGTVRMENRFHHKDGSYRWIYWTMTAEQGLIYVIGRDITADKDAAHALRQTEDQLRQLQKMDSVGQLTGGIAHDFNNLLTIIIGNLGIMERTVVGMPDRAVKALKAAMSGASRAATLTQRLLAYAQRQPLRPTAVDLNVLIRGIDDLIRRTQGETIEYEFDLGNDLPMCFCDVNQVETALLNLVINARDAMPRGGRVKIATGSILLDAAGAKRRVVSPGRYVMLTVRDTGTGMSPETLERVFEPFFTTKEAGKGTGLGLSMVYGFVKQSNGHIEIESVPGHGTTVRILLPALVAGQARHRSGTGMPVAGEAAGQRETILVTEDDASVRGYIVECLQELNYNVIEASDATAALEVIGQPGARIDLLLTDVVMPGMNGRELANRAREIIPDIRVLFMTGYSQDAFVNQGRLDPDIELIEKPFLSESLAYRVRAMLRGSEAQEGARPSSEPVA